jgi:hypothetical protein
MIGDVYGQELSIKNSREVERYNQEVSQNVAKIVANVPIPEGIAVLNFNQNIGNSSTTTR